MKDYTQFKYASVKYTVRYTDITDLTLARQVIAKIKSKL